LTDNSPPVPEVPRGNFLTNFLAFRIKKEKEE
jgi:hypothetical protein